MRQYHDLLKHILATGTKHEDRTGTGTISTFGYQTRFDLREGFPIVTTKRVPFRWVAEELSGFLAVQQMKKTLMRGAWIYGQNGRPTSRLLGSDVWTAISVRSMATCGVHSVVIIRR